jgi:hypothetical protein
MKVGIIFCLFALTSFGSVVACDLPEAQDAEIGCGADGASSPSCPNYPITPEAGDDSSESPLPDADVPDSAAPPEATAD